ncbi:MAG: archaeal proteasome endopeptidase complex subunit beta [Nitrososphaerota archaeon]|nr:archaeal proteasome endopeptidase complex subunit beta [Candidatus Bathyarchaeota archaeon]MDW8049421.1 archaeal proteasome endopeptidase complex subunit beta [Nitrososphaerota archaeon]
MSGDQTQYLYVPGATTVGVVCKDGVVLASEKRVSYGSFVMSKSGKKVFKITESIGAACAGLVSDMQILIREVGAYANLYRLESGRQISVKSAAKMVSNLLFNRRLFPLITETIVAGVDDEGPSMYVLDVLGSNIQDKYTAVGSGAEIAMGTLEDGYRDDLTVEEGKDLVTRAIKSAISRDAMSGDGIDFLIITKDGIQEESIKF